MPQRKTPLVTSAEKIVTDLLRIENRADQIRTVLFGTYPAQDEGCYGDTTTMPSIEDHIRMIGDTAERVEHILNIIMDRLTGD